jgi:hypothetical protein
MERLCFTVDPEFPWPPSKIDYPNLVRLDAFKKRLDLKLIRAQFTTVDDFTAKLIHALVEWLKRTAPPDNMSRMEHLEIAPPLPAFMFGREEDVVRLKARLGIGGTLAGVTVLRGWPGVGKTTVVNSLVYDPEIGRDFVDGILWVALGTEPDILGGLLSWARTLHLNTANMNRPEDLMPRVRAALRDKHALLIVDDIWDPNHAAFFNLAGRNCAVLCTTRFLDVATIIAPKPEDIYVLHVLDDTDALDLFAQLAPNSYMKYPDESRQLVHDLEGLPLAIRVAARLVETESNMGKNWDARDFFSKLRAEAQLLEGIAPDDRFDVRTGTTPTIQLLLKQSTDTLDGITRQRFAFLGSLAPKPAMFELETMQEIWLVPDPRPTIRKLVNRGLLESIPDQGLFQMHAVLVMHAESLLEDDMND